MTWEDVKKLENLTQLNLKIAMDALDDEVEHLQECRIRLEKAFDNIRDLTKEE